MAFARLPSKKGAMKHTDRTGAEQTAARQPEPTQEITVTQVTPDDILNDGGPITPATGDGTPRLFVICGKFRVHHFQLKF